MAVKSHKNGSAVIPTDESASELSAVPYLGPVRIRALAAIGITTLEDLKAASMEEIGNVKGIGMVNGSKLKEWLEQNHASETPDHIDPPAAAEPIDASQATDLVETDLEQIDQAIDKLKEVVPEDKRKKKLSKELEKLAFAVSGTPEGIRVLRAKEKAKAAKALDKIAKLLTEAIEKEKFSDKRQSEIGAELKDLRKRLEKKLK